MKRKTWDETRARQLLAEGKSDIDIADMVGATVGAIRAWRARNRLRGNPAEKPTDIPPSESAQLPEGSSKEVPAAEACSHADPPLEDTPTQETALESLLTGPVEISFSYGGCHVVLAAPDRQAAKWAAGYLSEIVNSFDTRAVNK